MAKSNKGKKGKKKKKDPIEKKAHIARMAKAMWERGQSELCEVRGSVIHGRGVYATQDIEEETQVIEYLGEFIDKEESERRANVQSEHAEATGDAAVYIFTLNDDWDIDGDVPWNPARLINHSCDPNCEAWIDEDQIFIYAIKDIWEGEELTFDYGFDIECYEDHPCLCGSENCVGYIVSREQWDQLEELKAQKAQEEASTV